jgi:integral membrane protein
MQKLRNAALRYRVMAWITGVVLAVAFLWMLLLWILWISDGGAVWGFFSDNETKPAAYSVLWIAHGWLYFIYLIVGVDLAFRMRYGILKTLGILLAGTIPFMSFVAERVTHRDVDARINASMGN